MKRGWISLVALMAAVGCSNDDAVNPGTWYSYRNPVELSDVQDPSVYEENGKFYLFSAGAAVAAEEGAVIDIIPIMESEDLTSWQRTTTVFNEDTKPSFVDGALPACPDVVNIDDKYVLYYSLSLEDGNSGIGVATADFISGPYIDRGSIIKSSSNISGVASPAFFKDGEKNYLVFGNRKGTYLVGLSTSGLSTSGAPVKIANSVFDAPYIVKHEGMYYLFATAGLAEGGAACQVVGRADSIEGPYKNKSGDQMLDGYSELLIGNSSKFVGAGHGSVFSLADGTTWILYNAYDLSNVGKGRTLMLDRIEWVGGWPWVRGQIGSYCADTPVLNK